MRSIHKGAIVALAGSAVAVIGGASPAFAATSITQPSDNPHTIPVDNNYNALPFDITASGYSSGQPVLIEICDGQPSTSAGWSPTTNCDISTSPSAVPASSTGSASFPASNRNTAIKDVHGQGPGDVFNCLTQTEINNSGPGTTPGQFPGEYTLDPNYTSTPTGQLVDPNVPAWTNCQLRASSNNSAVTSDQALITLTIPDTFPFTPEAPMAILLPVGASGLLAGGFIFARRRRSARLAA